MLSTSVCSGQACDRSNRTCDSSLNCNCLLKLDPFYRCCCWWWWLTICDTHRYNRFCSYFCMVLIASFCSTFNKMLVELEMRPAFVMRFHPDLKADMEEEVKSKRPNEEKRKHFIFAVIADCAFFCVIGVLVQCPLKWLWFVFPYFVVIWPTEQQQKKKPLTCFTNYKIGNPNHYARNTYSHLSHNREARGKWHFCSRNFI